MKTPYGYDDSTPLSALPYWLACLRSMLDLEWLKLRFRKRFSRYRHFAKCPGCHRITHTLISSVNSDGFWHPECEDAECLQAHKKSCQE